jgi:hypothetical protein
MNESCSDINVSLICGMMMRMHTTVGMSDTRFMEDAAQARKQITNMSEQSMVKTKMATNIMFA